MDKVSMPQLDVAVLGALAEIGKGGQGRVYATDAVRINQEWPVVFKEYDAPALAQLDVEQLGRMVAFVPQLDAESGRWLCERAAWPAAVVRRGSRVCGFLMRRIPEHFEVDLPNGSGALRRPAGFQFLLNPDDYLVRMALPIDDRRRLQLLVDLALTLSRFHRLGIVVGDLSPNNLLFHLGDQPRCFFIDCDAMRLLGVSVLAQTETPDWEVPREEAEPLATPASDAYKFGLLAVRLFARDQTSRDPAALAGVSADLADLARCSLAVSPTGRPAPAEWIPALTAATTCRGSGAAPPVQLRPTVGATTTPTAGGNEGWGGRAWAVLLLIVAVIYLIARFAG